MNLTRPADPLRRLHAACLASLLLALAAPVQAAGTCSEHTSALRRPSGMLLTPEGNLVVAETGTTAPHSGRLTIVDRDGHPRTLIDGLPSGIADVGDPSGPQGVALRGRTLYVTIGVGDIAIMGRDAAGNLVRGSAVPNPNGPSSPLFASVLAVHFSAEVERRTKGFTLTTGDHAMLAAGHTLELSNGGADRITVQRLADFPNYAPAPHPVVAGNVRNSNPFHPVVAGSQLYVTDGGRNHLWRVELLTRTVGVAAEFPPVPNPMFGSAVPGGPTLEAVPTGVALYGGELLVALFRGAPFPPGSSTVQRVDVASGTGTPLIAGLKTAIGVLPLPAVYGLSGGAGLLVLQHASAGPFFGGSGQLLHFTAPGAAPSLVADCLTLPTAMALDRRSGLVYVSELGGRLVRIAAPR